MCRRGPRSAWRQTAGPPPPPPPGCTIRSRSARLKCASRRLMPLVTSTCAFSILVLSSIRLARTRVRALVPIRSNQPAQCSDGFLRTQKAALFQQVADDHDDKEDNRIHQVPGRPGSNQCNRPPAGRPCHADWGAARCFHPTDSTWMATSAAAPPATRSARYCSSGNAARHMTATHRRPPAIMERSSRNPRDHFDAAVSRKAGADCSIGTALVWRSFAGSWDDHLLAVTRIDCCHLSNFAKNCLIGLRWY